MTTRMSASQEQRLAIRQQLDGPNSPIALLTDSDAAERVTRHAEDAIYDARRDYQRTAEQLASKAEWLASRMGQLQNAAQAAARFGRTAIGSSEAGSLATDVDRLCAELSKCSETVGRIEATFGVDTSELNARFQEIAS